MKVLALIAIAGVGSAIPVVVSPTVAVEAGSAETLETTDSSRGECLDCQECKNTSLHYVMEDVISGNSSGTNGHAHCSAIGDCFSGHADHSWVGMCGAFGMKEEDVVALSVGAETGNERTIRAMMARFPSHIIASHARSLGQVIGCDGGVVAQFVVSAAL
jgi:hypothetical protein